VYKRLLIPLDGSQMAESILPVAVTLARSLEASVVLIHIIEKNAPEAVHGERHLHDAAGAEAYLAQIAKRWFADVTIGEIHVHSEEVTDVGRSILQHVRETDSDLTLMCTHGRVGPKEFLVGSIAQHVAAAAVPVLFIRASAGGSQPDFRLQRILVALDGEPEHERGLQVSAELARACQSLVHLLTVVPSLNRVSGSWTQSVRLEPTTTDRLLSMEVDAAAEYLHHHRRRLEESHIAAACEVLRGDPAEEIIKAADDWAADLVVLGTHGTIGAKAFWAGSVAARIAHRANTPVLLVPASSSSDPKGQHGH
jgi:nucleotide-binding universal stress UspA family protein